MKINSSLKIVKIPDVLFFQEGPGVRRHQFTNHGIKLLNVGNINDGQINLGKTKIYISEQEGYGKYKHFLVDEGDLVIASSGIVVENFYNKIAFIKKEHLPLCLNTSTIRFRVLDKKILDINYFKYFLKTKFFANQLQKLITGSAQLNFGPSHLKKINLLLLPIEEQHRIVKILDLAQSLIEKRKQAIVYLDDYIKAVFLDMFGDPVKNQKEFPLTRLSTLGDWHSGGTPSRSCPDYFSGSIPWYSSGELNDIFISDSNEYISEIAVKESSAKKISTRCLLLGMYDSAALKSSITTIESSCNQAIAYAKLDDSKANVIYVYHCIQYGKNHYKKNQRGVRQKNLNLSMIKALEIPLPKIIDQIEFEMIFNQSFQLKQKMQSQLKELEDNFQAELQRAFRGD